MAAAAPIQAGNGHRPDLSLVIARDTLDAPVADDGSIALDVAVAIERIQCAMARAERLGCPAHDAIRAMPGELLRWGDLMGYVEREEVTSGT